MTFFLIPQIKTRKFGFVPLNRDMSMERLQCLPCRDDPTMGDPHLVSMLRRGTRLFAQCKECGSEAEIVIKEVIA